MAGEYAAYQPGSMPGPWAPPTDDQGLADVDPGAMASMPAPSMTANPAMGEVPLYRPTQQPMMTLRDAVPLNPEAPALSFSARRSLATPANEPKATPVTAPVEGSVSKIQKETAAAQTDMLKLQKDRQKIAADAEEATFQHAQAIGMQNAATLAETQRQDRIIAHHDAMADQQSTKELAGIKAESSRVANMHVDPTRALPKGIMGSIVGAIGAAIGGAGQALTGHNSFMDIVNTAIDRDIDAQKTNIQGAQANVARRTGMYQMMRQKFGDDRAALVATKLAYIESTDRYLAGLQAIATTEQGARVFADKRAELGQGAAQLEIGWNKERRAELAAGAAAQQARQDKLLAQMNWERTHSLAERAQDAHDKEAEAKLLEAGGKKGETAVPILGTNAVNKEQSNKVNEKLGMAKASVNALRDLADAREKISTMGLVGNKIKASPEWRVLQAKKEATITRLNVALGQGAISGGDYERASKMVGSIDDLTGDPHEAARSMADSMWQQAIDETSTSLASPAGSSGPVASMSTFGFKENPKGK